MKCMFMGYAANHAGNVYRMLNLKTRKVIITRNVKWLKASDENESKNVREETKDDEEFELEVENLTMNQMMKLSRIMTRKLKKIVKKKPRLILQ